jgi:2-phosphosulfolactate phosphatase
MQVDIQLLPVAPKPAVLPERMIVVIDVLRATSVMVHAMSQGALEIIPVTTVEEAFQLKSSFPLGTALLGGERGSRRIEGFDLGNSPREYVSQTVRGKRLILTTTNGTRAFHFVASGYEILVASFFNIGAVAKRCMAQDRDILIFPSGDEGNFSLEDTVCGGMLIDRMVWWQRSWDLTDAARAALTLYQRFKENLVEPLRLSNHGRDLVALELGEDLLFCAQPDTTDLVPIFKDGMIRLL